MTPARRLAAAVAVAVGASLLLAATPTQADSHDSLVVTVDEPKEGAVQDSATVTVKGSVRPRPEHLNLDIRVTEIVAHLEPVGDGEPVTVVVCNPCGPPGPFEKAVPVPSRNGQYRARVTAQGQDGVLGVDLRQRGGTGSTQDFGVAVRPAAPQDVKVEVSPERAVTISWSRNTEPDMLRYSVRRKDGTSETYRAVGTVAADATSPRLSLTDSLPATTGGDFTYQVVAVRQGATPGSTVSSDPAGTDTVSVAAPPATPGAGGPGALIGTFPPAQTGNTARPRPLEAPDTGFSETLPFGARPPGEEVIEEGEQEPRSLDVGTTTTEFVTRGRPLVPVAAGAILLLLAVHLRLLNKRVKSTPAAVGGYAYTDLAPLEVDPQEEEPTAVRPYALHPRGVPVGNPPAITTFPAPASRAPLFDYEHEQPVRAPSDDDRWADDDWDDEVRQVDAELREVTVARAR